MQPISIFDLAAQKAQWLSVRQSAVAGNIANVNTPGYGTVEIEPFESILDKTHVSLAATQPAHFGGKGSTQSFGLRSEDTFKASLPSENTVQLETELMKSGEIRRDLEINTAIVKSFHRMLLMSVRT